MYVRRDAQFHPLFPVSSRASNSSLQGLNIPRKLICECEVTSEYHSNISKKIRDHQRRPSKAFPARLKYDPVVGAALRYGEESPVIGGIRD